MTLTLTNLGPIGSVCNPIELRTIIIDEINNANLDWENTSLSGGFFIVHANVLFDRSCYDIAHAGSRSICEIKFHWHCQSVCTGTSIINRMYIKQGSQPWVAAVQYVSARLSNFCSSHDLVNVIA